MGSGNYIPKIVNRKIDEILKENNIGIERLAADCGVSVMTVYNWRRGRARYPAAEVAAMVDAKRASGEYPIPGPPRAELIRQKHLKAIEAATAARSPDWVQKRSETLRRRPKSTATKWHAVRKNYEEIRDAELADGHRVALGTLYNQSRRREDGDPGFIYEGRHKVYFFE